MTLHLTCGTMPVRVTRVGPEPGKAATLYIHYADHFCADISGAEWTREQLLQALALLDGTA